MRRALLVLSLGITALTGAADILPVMFKRPMDMHQTTFAMGEAVAHLHALWFDGSLQRTVDAQGVFRFGRVG